MKTLQGLIGSCCLAMLLLFVAGCGGSSSTSPPDNSDPTYHMFADFVPEIAFANSDSFTQKAAVAYPFSGPLLQSPEYILVSGGPLLVSNISIRY